LPKNPATPALVGCQSWEVQIVSFLFNNESFINELLENLKKELMEVIFSDNLSLFKKSIFIQGVFTYANLILSNNTSMSDKEKTKLCKKLLK
ncbi:hypothetical protein HMPREF9094_0258, partial [Fusobacterium animalis ATCC 51191]